MLAIFSRQMAHVVAAQRAINASEVRRIPLLKREQQTYGFNATRR